MAQIRSIKKHTPGLGGTPYIIIQTAKEGALSPLYFYDGGVKEFLNALGEFVDTTKYVLQPLIALYGNANTGYL